MTHEGRRTLCPRSCTTVRVELEEIKREHERLARDFAGFVLAVRPHLPPDLLAIADRILVEGFGVDRETLPDVVPSDKAPNTLTANEAPLLRLILRRAAQRAVEINNRRVEGIDHELVDWVEDGETLTMPELRAMLREPEKPSGLVVVGG